MPTDRQEHDIALRPWSETDLPLLERLLGDPAMTEHLGGPETPEQLRKRHERYCALRDTGNDRMFVIVTGPDATPVGSVGYWAREWRGETVWETGWSVLPGFQGQGTATRAMAAVIDRIRAAGGHRSVHAFPSVDNAPSNAICRKSGFALLGEVDFEYPRDHIMRCNDWALALHDENAGTLPDDQGGHDADNAPLGATPEHRIRRALDGRDNVRVATAESCTGGTIAARLTSQAGSSAYFVGSVVSYANDVKHRVLGVPGEMLENPGAVSEPVARAMAEGVRDLMGATHAVSTTGIAGPDGGTARKPVGTVYIGVATPEGTRVEHHVFPGDRAAVIAAASDRALALLLEAVS